MIIFGKLKLTSLCLIAMMTVFGCSKKFARENSPADNTQLELTPNKVSKNLLITFNNYSEYTSPVIYLRDGETPILANDSQGFPTTGGYDGEPSRTTEYNGISYNSSMQNVDLSKLNVVLADSNQDLFCGNLSFTVQKNNISFKTNSSNVLRSMTNCKFKLTSNYYDLNENKINLQFNYTLKDWMTTLGDSSQAQITANIIEGYCRNIPSHGCSSPIYLLSLSLDNLYITDISPVTSLINLVSLSLKNNAIKNIPSSISELSQLVYLDVRGNSIYNLPDSFSNLLNIKNLLIGYNDFTTFPEPISNLSNLENLWFSDSSLNRMPSSISKLVNLKLLDLRNNEITSVPESVTKLSNLKKLWLHNNFINSVSENIVNLKLNEIYLNNNQIKTLLPNTLSWINSVPNHSLSGNPGSPNFGN